MCNGALASSKNTPAFDGDARLTHYLSDLCQRSWGVRNVQLKIVHGKPFSMDWSWLDRCLRPFPPRKPAPKDLATTMMVYVTVFHAGHEFGVTPSAEFDGDPATTIHVFDQFET